MWSYAWNALTSLMPSFGAAAAASSQPTSAPVTPADAKTAPTPLPTTAKAAEPDEFSLGKMGDAKLQTESEHLAEQQLNTFYQQRKNERELEVMNLDNKYLVSTKIALLRLAQKRADDLHKIAAEQVASKQVKHFNDLAEAKIQDEFDRFGIERGMAQDVSRAYSHLQARRARSETHTAHEKLNQIYQLANQFRDKILANANARFPDSNVINNFSHAIIAINPANPLAVDKILKQISMLQEKIDFNFKGDQKSEEHHSKQRNKILAALEIAKKKLAMVPPKHTQTIIKETQPDLPRDHMFSRQQADYKSIPPAAPPLEATDLPPVISHYRRLSK